MDGRTTFVVVWMVILFAFAWMFSLFRLLGMPFYDRQHALESIHESEPQDPAIYNNTVLHDLDKSYYAERYRSFLPHVIGAILWWNLYFIQLIPAIRHKYKAFHRYLGRLLMVVALIQVVTGIELAMTSGSSTIKLTSFALAIAATYCVYRAWTYAKARDIPMHKYWVMRLVGYMHTIALQRFYFFLLVLTHKLGCYGLYPSLDDASVEEANVVVERMFDDSFVICFVTAILATEWYLAGQQGMMEPPNSSNNKGKPTTANNSEDGARAIAVYDSIDSERQPLAA